MAAGAPTGALAQKLGVRLEANINLALGALDLGVAFETKVRVTLYQQLPIHRTMWVVTDRAAFPQCFMLKNEWAGLFPVTLGATLVEACHREASRRFQNVAAVRVVALRAVHVAFDDGMMLRQVEFGVNVEMALEAGRRVIVRIDDELCAAAGFDVFAAGAVAGFAAGFAGHRGILKMDARVRAGGKFSDEVGMAIRAGFVADVMRAGDFQRHDD